MPFHSISFSKYVPKNIAQARVTLKYLYISIWISNLFFTTSVPEEGYHRNSSCALTYISTVVFQCIQQKDEYELCYAKK